MLTEALNAMAAAGGSAIVAAMATDAWGATRDRISRLLGRGDAARVTVVEGQLDDDATLIERASDDEREQALAELAPVWRRRLVRLLEEQPGVESELREAVTAIHAALPSSQQAWAQTNITHGGTAFAVQGGSQQVNYYRGEPDEDRKGRRPGA